jgi:DNA-binding NtrC family response regulator
MATVLAIDDDETILDVVQAILSQQGYGVLRATNTHDGLAILKERTVDVLLLDMVMPGQGGMDFLMELRRDRPKLPVIVMSGKIRTDMNPFKALATQFGAVCILAKPFSTDELNDAIEGVLKEYCC